jgi:excisionase family DNA binding protein
VFSVAMTPDSDTDLPSPPPDDPWLTVAEFAEATRVRPVTVRSWIAKGQLKATRSGKRKWLIRQSELDRMLNRESFDRRPPEVWDAMYEEYLSDERARSETEDHEAGYRWDLALERSRMAPPDAGFSSRLRQIATAAAWWSAALKRRAEVVPEFGWKSVSGSVGMTLSYELRSGGNRPGPRDAWERFDRTVTRLGKAMEGDRLSAVTGALSDLADAARDISDTLDERSDQEGRGDAETVG